MRTRKWCIFHLYGEQKPLSELSPNFFGGRRPRRNHAVQIWWRSVRGFLVGWGSKFAFSHRLWRSSLQHSHYRVRCDTCYSHWLSTTAVLALLGYQYHLGHVTSLGRLKMRDWIIEYRKCRTEKWEIGIWKNKHLSQMALLAELRSFTNADF